MKKILQRCMAGLLTAVLCSGGVYADSMAENTMTLETAFQSAASGETKNLPYTDTFMLESAYIDLDGDSSYIKPGKVYKLPGVEKDDILIAECYGSNGSVDTCIELYYQTESNQFVELYEYFGYDYDSDPDNNNGSGTTLVVEIPATGTWYAVCRGYQDYSTGECTVNFEVTDDYLAFYEKLYGQFDAPLDFYHTQITDNGDNYTWDAATKTLTLHNNFSISTAEGHDAAILLPVGATVVVEGNAIINSEDVHGIFAAGDMTILLKNAAELEIVSGDNGIFSYGSIIVSGNNRNNMMKITTTKDYADAIDSDYGDIIIDNCIIEIESESECIIAENNVHIKNSTLTLTSYDEECIDSNIGDVLIENSTITVTAEEQGIEGETVTITGCKLDITADEGEAILNPKLVRYNPALGGIPDTDEQFNSAEEAEVYYRNLISGKVNVSNTFHLYDMNGNRLTDYPISYSDNLFVFEFTYYDGEIEEYSEYSLASAEEGYWYLSDYYWAYDGVRVGRLVTVAEEEDTTPEEEPTYNIPQMPFLCALNVNLTEGGSANASGNLLIAKYATRLLRFTADDGYEIADVLVNGKSVGAVSSYKVGPATANTTVEVRFAPIVLDTSVEAPADAAVDAEDDLDDDE